LYGCSCNSLFTTDMLRDCNERDINIVVENA
jgi:hypothetical protein